MLFIQETFVNDDTNTRFSEGPLIETQFADAGALFRDLRKEYGRCMGHVYIDTESRGVLAIGWIFRSRQKYEGGEETYIRSVWVKVFDACEQGDVHELLTHRGHLHGVGTGLKHHVLKGK